MPGCLQSRGPVAAVLPIEEAYVRYRRMDFGWTRQS